MEPPSSLHTIPMPLAIDPELSISTNDSLLSSNKMSGATSDSQNDEREDEKAGVEEIAKCFDGLVLDLTTPAKEFVIFSYLPVELRTKIWGCAFPGSRIISINDIHAKLPIDNLLHVSYEARQVSLQRFTFQCDIKLYQRRRATIFLDLPHDSFYISGLALLDIGRTCQEWTELRLIDSIEHLILEPEDEILDVVTINVSNLQKLPNLKKITVLVGFRGCPQHRLDIFEDMVALHDVFVVPIGEWLQLTGTSLLEMTVLTESFREVLKSQRCCPWGCIKRFGVWDDLDELKGDMNILFQKLGWQAQKHPGWKVPDVEIKRFVLDANKILNCDCRVEWGTPDNKKAFVFGTEKMPGPGPH